MINFDSEKELEKYMILDDGIMSIWHVIFPGEVIIGLKSQIPISGAGVPDILVLSQIADDPEDDSRYILSVVELKNVPMKCDHILQVLRYSNSIKHFKDQIFNNPKYKNICIRSILITPETYNCDDIYLSSFSDSLKFVWISYKICPVDGICFTDECENYYPVEISEDNNATKIISEIQKFLLSEDKRSRSESRNGQESKS